MFTSCKNISFKSDNGPRDTNECLNIVLYVVFNSQEIQETRFVYESSPVIIMFY